MAVVGVAVVASRCLLEPFQLQAFADCYSVAYSEASDLENSDVAECTEFVAVAVVCYCAYEAAVLNFV